MKGERAEGAPCGGRRPLCSRVEGRSFFRKCAGMGRIPLSEDSALKGEGRRNNFFPGKEWDRGV